MTETIGITRGMAMDAVQKHGWTPASLLVVHKFAERHRMSVTGIYAWGIILNGRFIAYRRENWLSLLAMVSVPPPLDRTYVCYSDGSGTTGDKAAGIGVVVERPGLFQPELIAENVGHGTNNYAELSACWRALRAIPDVTARILIRTDSEYSIGALTKDWARNANADLITAIREDLALRGDRVTFEHVDGHSGVEGNEIADQLAKIGRKLVSCATPPL